MLQQATGLADVVHLQADEEARHSLAAWQSQRGALSFGEEKCDAHSSYCSILG